MKPPYTITGNILALVASISEKIGVAQSAHLSKPPTELRKKNRVRTIQSSLEIEGNTLTVEQITAILENKRVVGPEKDILEVKNAIEVYDRLTEFDPFSVDSMCSAHLLLMKGLVDRPGELRSTAVGIVRGNEVTHIAPPGAMVKGLLNDLFAYLANDEDLLLVKSCVFHYELEFIHPFLDGNGRMGRLWQTLVLTRKSPLFEYLPVESLVKLRQQAYYEALGKSDTAGESTVFVEFMLTIINDSLEELVQARTITLTAKERLEIFEPTVQGGFFTRKDYLLYFKQISSATASRDLKYALERHMVERIGDKNASKYRFVLP